MKYLFLFSFLLQTLLLAQTKDFSLIIHQAFNAKLFDVTQDYDRSISAVGFSQEFSQSTTSTTTYHNAFDYLAHTKGNAGTVMRLLKVSNKAKIIFNKKLNIHNMSKALAVVKTPSNGYFIGGHTMDGSLLVLKLGSAGELLFFKKFGTKNDDRLHNLLLLRDGGILAIGSSMTSRARTENFFQMGLGKNDIYLTRFSTNGQILWSKKYGTIHDDKGIDAVEAEDGSLVVLSTTEYENHMDVTLMRIDENGNKRWLKHYASKEHISAHKIIKLREKTFVAALSQHDSMQKEQIRLIKFDLYKNIISDQKIFTTYPSVITDIQEFSNGMLVGVGYVQDTYNTDALAMLFDSHLSLLKQEHFGNDNYDAFYALHILNNSQVAAVGLHTDPTSQESNMWIVKLNKDLSMAQISLNIKTAYEVLNKIFKEEIAKKELFIGEDLSLNLIAPSLYFQAGVSKLNTKQKKFLQHFTQKILVFLKNNQAIIESFEVNGHASSEWKGADFSTNYLKNAKLSMARAYHTLHFIFKSSDKPSQVLLTKLLKGSGNSYTKSRFKNTLEDKEKSRRVSFKILLK